MLQLISLLFILATSSILSLAIYRNNPKSATNQSFIAAGISIIFWSISTYLSLNAPSPDSTLFLIRLSMLTGTLMATSFLLLAHTFPSSKFLLNKKWYLILGSFALVTMIVSISPFMFTSLKITASNIEPIPGPGILLFILVAIGYNLISFFILIRKYLHAKGLLKNQLRYVVLGVVVFFLLLITTNFIFAVFFHKSNLVFLGPLFTLIYIGSVAYSILRHRLLEIRLLIARSIAYTLLITFFAALYTAAIYLITGSIFQSEISFFQIVIYAALALFVALTFQRLKYFFEKITSKIFFQNQYLSNELLSILTKIIVSTLYLEDLTSRTLYELLSVMNITQGAFLLLDKQSFYPPITQGYSENPEVSLEMINIFHQNQRIYLIEDENNEETKAIMTELKAAVIVPLTVGQIFHGVLLLGEKKSGEIYSEQDIQVLEIFGPEVSVAVQNAKEFDEIKKFNITLSQEIAKATTDLRAANEKLEELDQLKDDFVSVTSHELRTPMTAIRSYAWMALNRSDISLTEKMKKYLSRTLISTERLINLVNEMLNISRIESGRIEINPKSFDIHQFVLDVVAEVEVKAREKNLKLTISADKSVPQVFADPDKVHQVLLNLLGNALKFTPEGGNINISFFTDGKNLETSIKDSGVGISKDDMGRLFKKFSRLDNSYVAAATSGGTGLGLYISKSLTEIMHGKIWAKSEGLGQGTTFTFSLPVATEQLIKNAEKYTLRPKGEARELEAVAI